MPIGWRPGKHGSPCLNRLKGIKIRNMKKEGTHHTFDSLSEAHQAFGLPKPLHPLMSLIDNTIYPLAANRAPHSHVLNFYKIAYRTDLGEKFKYGQDYYDFNEGGLLFAAPS